MSIRKLGLSLAALLAIGAVMASSASAAVETMPGKFFVEGALLTGSKTVTGSAVTNGVLESEIGTTKIKLQSTAFSCEGCKIENAAKTEKAGAIAFGEGKIVFENVTVVEPANCTVTGETGVLGKVPTKQLAIHGDWMDTVEAQKHAFIQFLPLSGGTFAQFTLGGAGCAAISGAKNVSGTVFGESKLNTGEEAATQELVFSQAVQETTGASLLLGIKPAKFSGTGAFKLTTGEKFSIKTEFSAWNATTDYQKDDIVEHPAGSGSCWRALKTSLGVTPEAKSEFWVSRTC
ncbi:MAG TPA: hypothetical protein VGI17_00950 [Solirubrobacterales bacterium]|jgi:hypothetical protein